MGIGIIIIIISMIFCHSVVGFQIIFFLLKNDVGLFHIVKTLAVVCQLINTGLYRLN